MKLGPKDNYLCFIPAAPTESPQPDSFDEVYEPRSPAQSLASLNSMWGSCLYVSEGQPYLTRPLNVDSTVTAGSPTPTVTGRTYDSSGSGPDTHWLVGSPV